MTRIDPRDAALWAEEMRRRAEERARAQQRPATPAAPPPEAPTPRPAPADVLEKVPRLFGREIPMDFPIPRGIPVEQASPDVVLAPPPTTREPEPPPGPRTDVLPRLPSATVQARLDADLDRQELAAALGAVATPATAVARLEGGFVTSVRPLVGVKRMGWAETAPGLLKGALAKLAEKAGSLEARATQVMDVLSQTESRHARTVVGFDRAAGSLEKAAYKAGIAKTLAKLVPGDPAASLDRVTAARQQFVEVQAHAGEAEAALRELAPSARETPWALQEVRALKQEAGGARWESARTEARGELLQQMDAGEGFLTEGAPEPGQESAPGAEFEFGEADLARIGTGLDPSKPPSQTHWSDHMINTVCERGRQQGGITDEQGGRNFELARTVLAGDDSPGPKELGAADLAAVLKMSGADLAKVDPNQLQAASSYVSKATTLEDQQHRLRKALDTFQVLEKTGLPKFNRAQMIDELWNVAKVPKHALEKLKDTELTQKFQEVLATVNAGPGQSEIKIGKHNLKLTVGEDGTVKKSTCKKPGFFSRVWSGIEKVAPIALTVASFIPVTAPFARAAQGVISLVQAIKAKTVLGIAAAGASLFGGVSKLAQAASRALQGVSQVKSGNWIGGLASMASAVGSGLKGVSDRLADVAGKLDRYSSTASALGAGVASFDAYKKASRAVTEAKEALASAQASGDPKAMAAAEKALAQAETQKRAALIGGAAGATTAASALAGARGLFPGKSKAESPARTSLERNLQYASRALGVAQGVAGKDYTRAAVSAFSLGATAQSAKKGGAENRWNDAANIAQAGLDYHEAEKGRKAANQAAADAQKRLDAAKRDGNPELVRQAEADLKKARGAAESAFMGGLAASESLLKTARDIGSRNRLVKSTEEAKKAKDRLASLVNDADAPVTLREEALAEHQKLRQAEDDLEKDLAAAAGDEEKVKEAQEQFDEARKAAETRITKLTQAAATGARAEAPTPPSAPAETATAPGLASMRRPQRIAAAKVTQGVTVWEVSQRTGVPVERILEFNAQSGNPLIPEKLQIGQQILVPMDPEDVKFKPLSAEQVHDLKVRAIAERKAKESITVPPVRSSDEPTAPQPSASDPAQYEQGTRATSNPMSGIGLRDLENAGKAFAGAMTGLLELAASPVILTFKAAYNLEGALAYSATDLVHGEPDPAYKAQADAVSGAIQATKEFFEQHTPSELPGLALDALTAGLNHASEAIDRGDAFEAGRGFANFAGGVYLFEKTLEGLPTPKFEPQPSLQPAPATAGSPGFAAPASEVPRGLPPRLGEPGVSPQPAFPMSDASSTPLWRAPGALAESATPVAGQKASTSGSQGTSSGRDVGTIAPKSSAPASSGSSGSKPEVLARSKLEHQNASIAEIHAYETVIKGGHIPIQGPGKVTARGPDLITYDQVSREVVVWDAKYRGPGGSYPSSIPPAKLQRWLPNVRAAIEGMPNGPAKSAFLDALAKGRILGKVFKWPPQ